MRADSDVNALLASDALVRAASTLLSRLRSRTPRHGKKKKKNGAEPLYLRVAGERSISLSGDFMPGSTHSITSVVSAVRQVDGGGAAVLRATAALDLTHTSPFLLVDHVGPKIARAEPAVFPRAGMQALVYVLRGCVVQRNSATLEATRVRDREAALLTAGRGVVVQETAQSGPLEMLRVWVNVPRAARDAQPGVAHSRELPEYVVYDADSGEEEARVRVVLGDAVPVKSAQSARAVTKPLVATARRVGVYDVQVAEGASVRVQLRCQRVLLYVRDGAVRVGGRVVKKGALAVLHGPGGGCVILQCEGEESCACVVLEGEQIAERVEWTPAGFVAGSPREMRRSVKRHAKGEMGTIFTDAL